MSDSPYVIEVTLENFNEVVVEGSRQRPVLIDFWASWCQPCQALIPILTKLADEYQGKFLLAKINTEEQQEIAMQFQIRSIPACKLFVDGAPVDEFSGALQENEIRAFLDKYVEQESDDRIQQAQQLILQGNSEDAAQFIQQLLNENPSNPDAILCFAQLKASMGESEEAEKALDSLPYDEQQKPEVVMLRGQLFFGAIASTAPDVETLLNTLTDDETNSEARYQLGALLVMKDRMEDALEQLLILMKMDRAYEDDAARKAMIRIFDILGEHPLTSTFRSRMSNLLY